MRVKAFGSLPLIALWALPLLGALAAVLVRVTTGGGWVDFLAHPQMPGGMALALWTGTASTVMALGAAILIVMALHGTMAWRHVPLLTGAALTIPHLAFGIGFGFLIMPSGALARLFVGGEAPPDWVTTQDPLGLSLIAVLVLKEVPFIVLMLWSVMSQGDAAVSLAGQARAARSLGHGTGSVWLRVLLPQVLRRLLWPMVIVWVYGVTVVDVALVIGPTQPPTIGVVIWADLNDADLAINRRGMAGAALLAAALAALAAATRLLFDFLRPALRGMLSRGPPLLATPVRTGWSMAMMVVAIYGAVLLVLVLLSVTPRWPYPMLLGEGFSIGPWMRLNLEAAVLSVGLAITTALTAVTLALVWFECVVVRRDRWVLWLALAALALPPLTLAAGQYVLLLRLDLTGTLSGLYVVHLAPVAAYGFIVLAGPYRGFDQRYVAAGKALGASAFRVWREVKLPLLKAPIATALAVGFSVSLVQFVPAQLIAAGRYSTLPMEAVTLASGGDRALTAAAALALALPAFAVFGLAAIAGRRAWR